MHSGSQQNWTYWNDWLSSIFIDITNITGNGWKDIEENIVFTNKA